MEIILLETTSRVLQDSAERGKLLYISDLVLFSVTGAVYLYAGTRRPFCFPNLN